MAEGLAIANAWVTIKPSMKNFRSDVYRQLSGLEADGKKAGDKFGDSMVQSIGSKLKFGLKASVAGAGVAAGGVLAASITKGLGRLNAIEGAEAKLKGLGNSAETVSGVMDNALASVKGTAHGLGEAASTAASMVAAGIKPGEQLEQTLKTVGDTAAIAGRSMEDVGLIFGSVAARGKLQGDDMLQLMSSGIPVLQLLSEELGVTSAEVSEMVSKGEIDFATFEKAMREGMGGAALEMGNTFRGSLANMSAAMGRFGAELAGPAFAGAPKVFTAITSVFDEMTNAFKPAGEQISTLLVPAFEQVAGVIETRVAPFAGQLTEKFGELAEKAAEKIVDPALWEQAGNVFANIKDTVEQLAPSLTDIGGSLFDISKNISVATWQALGDVLNTLAPILRDVLVPLLEDVADFMRDNPGVVEAVVKAWLGFKAVQTITGPVGKASKAVLGFGRNAKNVADATKIFGKSLKGGTLGADIKKLAGGAEHANPIIQQFGNKLTATTKLAGGFKSGAGGALKLLGGLATKINPVAAIISTIAAGLIYFFTQTETGQKLLESFVNALKTGFESAKETFQTFKDKVTEVWDSITAKVGSVMDTLGGYWESFKSTMSTIGSAVGEVFSAGLETVKATLGAWWESIKTVFSTGWEIVKDVFATGWTVIVDLFTGKWKEIPNHLRAGWELIKQHFSDGLEKIKDILAGLGAKLIELWGPIKEKIGAVWETVKTVTKEKFEQIVGTIAVKITDGIAKVGEFKDNVVSFFVDLGRDVVNEIKRIPERIKELPGQIKELFHDAKEWLKDAGHKIIDGLLDGLKAGFEKVKSWFSTAKNFITSGFSGITASAEDRLNQAPSMRPATTSVGGRRVSAYADGGVEHHVAQIAPAGAWRVWAEPETGGEAYIPLANAKRERSTRILATVADHFGLALADRAGRIIAGAGRAIPPTKVQAFADGGITAKRLLQFARGKNINGLQAPRSLEGAQYVWGGGFTANWGDCSGAMSALAAFAAGLRNLGRKFTTMDEAQALEQLGFTRGRSEGKNAFEIGFLNGGPGGGHTAGTIYEADGKATNVEMGGNRGNGQIGGAAAGARAGAFTDIFYRNLDGSSSASITSTSVDGVEVESEGSERRIEWGRAESLASEWEKQHKRRLDLASLGLPLGVFDTGGVLRPGGLALNLSGKPEVVINNQQLSAFSKLANNLGALVKTLEPLPKLLAPNTGGRPGSNLGAFAANAGIRDWLQVANLAGFGEITAYIEPTLNAYEKLQDSLLAQKDASSALQQAEHNLSEARATGNPEQIAQAEQDLAKARGVVAEAAKAAGFAEIELVLTIVQTIGKIFKQIWEAQVKAAVGVRKAIEGHLRAVYEWNQLVAQQRETVSKLQQQVVNDRIALTKATWDARLAQVNLIRTRLEGVKSVAEAEAKLQAERDRVAKVNARHWGDMTLAYDRYRHAEMVGMNARFKQLVTITPEILALEHEVNAVKLANMSKQYKAALAGLEASHAQQMAALNLAQSQIQLAQQSAQLAQMQKEYFGLDAAGALTGANTAKLYADKAQAEGRANRGLFGWIGSFFSDPIGTLKYAFGGGARADREYARHLDEEIQRRESEGKGLGVDLDPAVMQEVKRLYGLGLNEQAENLIKSSSLGAPTRALEEAKEDQQLLLLKQQEENLRASQERLQALIDFETQAQPLREMIAAFDSASNAHQYTADAIRESNEAVREATRALAEFEAENARAYAASASGEKTVINIELPKQDVYTREQMDAVLEAVGKIPELDVRVNRLEKPPASAGAVLASAST